MNEIIYISILNIVCFLIGAIVGQRVRQDKPVIVNPVQAVKEYKEEKEIEKEDDYFKTIAENIDNYNGTSIGQKSLRG